MEVLSFKISGKLAHFRKFYANNTAFSFTIPPRTSLMGIVAAFMGWQRDSYYEVLASENINFGIRVLTPLKKSFHRLNLLSIKKLGDLSKKWSSDFRGEGGRIQTPFEIVSGWDLTKDDVTYQVFLSPTEQGKNIFHDIKEHFLEKQPVFNISLGIANFNASFTDIAFIDNTEIEVIESDDYLPLSSAVPSNYVVDLEFKEKDASMYNFVEEELMPSDFLSNNNREVRRMNRILFSTTANPLRIKLNTACYKIKFPKEEIIIQFMDK